MKPKNFKLLASGFALAALLLMTAACAGPKTGDVANMNQPAKTYKVKSILDIAYKPDHKLNRLDLFLPEGAKDFPILMFIHGGGYMTGDKSAQAFIGHRFAREGIGVASINYRLSPAFKHPAHMEDTAAAFAWLHAHIKEYGGDPKNFFVSGHSAGGHLAALLAVDDRYLLPYNLSTKNISGAIPISGPLSIKPERLATVAASYKEIFGGDPTVMMDAMPMTHASAQSPPFLLLCADGDDSLLVPQYALMAKTLLERGAKDVTVKVIANRQHDTIRKNLRNKNDEAAQLMSAFMHRLMK